MTFGAAVSRGKAKKAGVVLYYKPNLPLAVIEVKDNNHGDGDGMQHALDYGVTLEAPFVFSTNGDDKGRCADGPLRSVGGEPLRSRRHAQLPA